MVGSQDLAIVNANVRTMDAGESLAKAVLLRGGRITTRCSPLSNSIVTNCRPGNG